MLKEGQILYHSCLSPDTPWYLQYRAKFSDPPKKVKIRQKGCSSDNNDEANDSLDTVIIIRAVALEINQVQFYDILTS